MSWYKSPRYMEEHVERWRYMLKGNPVDSGQNDMFRERLDRMINMSHRLVTLSKIVKWDWLESEVSKHYCLNNGRPGGCFGRPD